MRVKHVTIFLSSVFLFLSCKNQVDINNNSEVLLDSTASPENVRIIESFVEVDLLGKQMMITGSEAERKRIYLRLLSLRQTEVPAVQRRIAVYLFRSIAFGNGDTTVGKEFIDQSFLTCKTPSDCYGAVRELASLMDTDLNVVYETTQKLGKNFDSLPQNPMGRMVRAQLKVLKLLIGAQNDITHSILNNQTAKFFLSFESHAQVVNELNKTRSEINALKKEGFDDVLIRKTQLLLNVMQRFTDRLTTKKVINWFASVEADVGAKKISLEEGLETLLFANALEVVSPTALVWKNTVTRIFDQASKDPSFSKIQIKDYYARIRGIIDGIQTVQNGIATKLDLYGLPSNLNQFEARMGDANPNFRSLWYQVSELGTVVDLISDRRTLANTLLVGVTDESEKQRIAGMVVDIVELGFERFVLINCYAQKAGYPFQSDEVTWKFDGTSSKINLSEACGRGGNAAVEEAVASYFTVRAQNNVTKSLKVSIASSHLLAPFLLIGTSCIIENMHAIKKSVGGFVTRARSGWSMPKTTQSEQELLDLIAAQEKLLLESKFLYQLRTNGAKGALKWFGNHSKKAFISLVTFTIVYRGLMAFLTDGEVPFYDSNKTFIENYGDTAIWGGSIFLFHPLISPLYARGFISSTIGDGTLFLGLDLVRRTVVDMGKNKSSLFEGFKSAWSRTTYTEIAANYYIGAAFAAHGALSGAYVK